MGKIKSFTNKMGYKFLEHTADLKVSVSEKTMEKSFASSALALKEAICGKIKVKSLIKKKIKVSGKDYESLLYNFLEEFLYLIDAKGFLLSKIDKLKISGFELEAEVSGDKSSNYKSQFSNDVKAITYNEMFVRVNKEKCDIQFVLDV